MRGWEASEVVIGSGPGGAITAALLAEAGRDVLLLEEGPALPLDSCQPFSLDEMTQKYRNRGVTAGLGKPSIAYVEGCVVGGGSEINSGLYHRAPVEALSRWRSQWGVSGLDDAVLLDCALKNELELSVQTIPGIVKPPASLALDQGARALGLQCAEVPRWFEFDGRLDSFGVPKGQRRSMSKTFIPRFMAAGGRLATGVRVTRLEPSGTDWLVHADTHGRRTVIRSGRVFLCAGAIQTPFILRRSGITHAVGDRLLMHPTVKVVARFSAAINGDGSGVGVHQIKQFAPRASLGCSVSTRPHLALAMLDHPAYRSLVENQWRNMAVYYAMIPGGGHGTVRHAPGFCDPLVRYSLTPQGRRDLAFGIRKLCEVLLAAGACEVFPCISGFGEPIRSLTDLERVPEQLPASRINPMTIHLLGSCPMGGAISKSPCDSFGGVRGRKRLFVNDASLLCDSPGVNPQGTLMAIARRNVLNILEDS